MTGGDDFKARVPNDIIEVAAVDGGVGAVIGYGVIAAPCVDGDVIGVGIEDGIVAAAGVYESALALVGDRIVIVAGADGGIGTCI